MESRTPCSIGSLFLASQNQHSFLQVYFVDSGEVVQRRKSLFQGLEYSILLDVQDMLHQHNRYISELRCAYEFVRNYYDSYVIVISENARPSGEHERRYNAPTSNDIAVLMPNDAAGYRDIVLHTKSVDASVIFHQASPILFPLGADGWSLQLKLSSRQKISKPQ
ncbi:DNA helicase [Elysia marginata]|uniref:DNA helicase n=1 Tax=Elysia marginata TaxID=1093978 RepID=A0AAV4IEX9_9GAST|nr:DNA helicase [Elysia marginata]